LKILIIGTGNMGSALAQRLSKAGFEIYLWNRTEERARKIAKDIGGIYIKDLLEGIQKCEAAISFVSDDKALLNVILRVPRADGLLFINSATISPLTSEKVSEYLENRGICYVEAPVIGGPSTIEKGEAITLVSGKNFCKSASMNIIEKFSSEIIDLGDDPKKAQVLKLSFNSVLIVTLEILSEALLISEEYDISLESIKKAFKNTVFEFIISKYIDRLHRKDQKPSFRLSLAAKDLYDALEAARSKNLSTPLISVAHSIYELASRYGFRDEDYSRIYWFLRERKS